MARNTGTMIPTPKGGLLPKIVVTGVVLGILCLVIKHPSDAATMATNIADFIGSAIDGFASFFQHLS